MFLLTPKESREPLLTFPESLFCVGAEFQLVVRRYLYSSTSSTGFSWMVVLTAVSRSLCLLEKVTTMSFVLLTFISRHTLSHHFTNSCKPCPWCCEGTDSRDGGNVWSAFLIRFKLGCVELQSSVYRMKSKCKHTAFDQLSCTVLCRSEKVLLTSTLCDLLVRESSIQRINWWFIWMKAGR